MSLLSIPQRFQNAFSLFGIKEKSILGVDIGSASIKIVQLRKEKERAVLETYGELSLALFATVATLVTFTFFWFLEQKLISRK